MAINTGNPDQLTNLTASTARPRQNENTPTQSDLDLAAQTGAPPVPPPPQTGIGPNAPIPTIEPAPVMPPVTQMPVNIPLANQVGAPPIQPAPPKTDAETWQQYAPSLQVDDRGRLTGATTGKVGALQEMIRNNAPSEVINDYLSLNPDVREALTGNQIVVTGIDSDGAGRYVVVNRDEYNSVLDIKDVTAKLNRLIEIGIFPPDTKVIGNGTPEIVAEFNKEFDANVSPDFPYLTPGQETSLNETIRQQYELGKQKEQYQTLIESGVVTPSGITIPPEGSPERSRYTDEYWRVHSADKIHYAKAAELGITYDELQKAGIDVSRNTYQSYINLNKYNGPEGYDTVGIMEGLRDGKVTTENLETVFGDTYAAQLNRLKDYLKTDDAGNPSVDVQSIINDVESGELAKSVATVVIPEEYFKQVQEYNDAAASQKRVYTGLVSTAARLKDIEIGDPSNLTETEIYNLLKSNSIEPASLVAAGNSVGKVNIALATLSAEYKQQQDALDRIEPYGSEDGTYTVAQVANFLNDYPNGEKDLKSANFKQDFIDEAKTYQQELNQGRSYIEEYLKTPDFGPEGYTLANAIDNLGIKLPPIPYPFNPRTGQYEDVENERLISQKDTLVIHWNDLTDDQKNQVVQAFARDPNKGSYFAAVNELYNTIAQKGGVAGSLVFAPILPVTNVAAKQITLDEAKALLSKEYGKELDTLSQYVKGDGTFDIRAIENAINTDFTGQEQKRILEATGYSDVNSLKDSLTYYNNSVKITPQEWALASGVALADVLSFGGSGALSGLGTAGAWTSRALWTTGGALLVPSAITTIENPNAATWEKVLAGAAPVLMFTGAFTVKPGVPVTTAEGLRGGVVQTVERLPLRERVGNALYKAGYNLAKFTADERGGSLTVGDVNIAQAIRNLYGKTVYGVTGAIDNIARATDTAINQLVTKAIETKSYLKYGIKEDAVNALRSNLEDFRVARVASEYIAGNVKNFITRTGGQIGDLSKQVVEDAIWQMLRTKAYLKYGISEDVATILRNSRDFVTNVAGDIRDNIVRTYNQAKVGIENAIDTAVLKSINAENYLKYGLQRDIVGGIQTARDFTRYLAGEVKIKVSDIAGATAERSQQLIEDAIWQALRAKSYLKYGLKDDFISALEENPAYIRELARDINRQYIRSKLALERFVDDATLKALNAESYLKYGLDRDITQVLQRNKLISKYLIDRAKQGVQRGIADAYSSANLRKTITDIEDAIRKNDDTAFNKAVGELDDIAEALPEGERQLVSDAANELRQTKEVDVLDEVKRFLDETEKPSEPTTKIDKSIDDLIDDIDEYLKDKQDRGEPITPDDVERGSGGTKTAVKEKTEIKPETETKTAEELATELFPEEETKTTTETAPETKPSTRTGTRTTELTPTIPLTGAPETELGVISYPFDPLANPDAAREYERLLRELGLTRGYIEEQGINSALEKRIEELSLTMTREDAIKQALEEFGIDPRSFETAAVSPFSITETAIKEQPVTSPFEQAKPKPLTETKPFEFPQERPFEQPVVETETETGGKTKPVIETRPETFAETLTEPETRPLPETAVEAPPRTPETETGRLLPPPLPPKPEMVGGDEAAKRIKPGTITWRQGLYWRVLPPPYKQEDFFAMASAPPGIYKYATGKGSARKTLQVIGGPPTGTAEVDLGWARIRLTPDNKGEVSIQYLQDSDANTGKREFTVGMGAGQIPIEVWREGKAQGKTLEEVGLEWQAEQNVETQRIPREPQPRRTYEPEPMPETTMANDILSVRPRPRAVGRTYLGRELPGSNLNVAL